MTEENRILIGNAEVERTLGGGIVEGSMILLGGEPGIGKSTLALQIPLHCPELKILYVSGEESQKQIKMRAQRLERGIESAHRSNTADFSAANAGRGAANAGATFASVAISDAATNPGDSHSPTTGLGDNCLVLCETQLENILHQAREVAPQLIIIDSIQTIYSDSIDSSPASVSQVRECAAALLRFAKESNIPIILIGHITKDGSIAGPKILEHIVDVVLQFEGDTRHSYRVLRGIKNRFGSTAEIALFEMTDRGLREISNPSDILAPLHKENLSGIAVSAMIDGSRPFLVEIQALVSTAAYGMPQRSATGYDSRRLNMLLAVLEKRAGFKLSAKDVFLNIAGGLKVVDPACDLAVVCSILSSNFDLEISPKTCFAAEVGLSGEIRPVGQIERRISEAKRLGYKSIYISSYNLPEDYERPKSFEIVEVADIPSLCKKLFQ